MIRRKARKLLAMTLISCMFATGLFHETGDLVYALELTEEVTSETVIETEDNIISEVEVESLEACSVIIEEKKAIKNADVVNEIDEETLLQSTPGTYDVENAFKLLSLINGERKKEGKTMLSMDMGLYDAAKIRAVDIVTSFSHTRPDGTGWFSVFPAYQKLNIDEMLAQNSNDPSKIYDKWMETDTQKSVMLSNSYTCVGIACYYVPNSQYKYYWALCFGDTLKTPIYQNGNNITTNAPVIYNGVDYSAVYNYNYYINKYADIKNAFGNDADATLHHFVTAGMKEGRQGCDSFNVTYYKNRYPELRREFGNDLVKYFIHYMNFGLKEGRDGKTACDTPIESPDDSGDTLAMYRLYNPNSGEHFYTANEEEKNNLVDVGWRYEGIAWYAPKVGEPVYRLYNGNAGDHHYTLDEKEKDMLINVGWKYEGIAWYSGGDVPLYRAYNPNAIAGSHHYTIDSQEIDNLVDVGWRYEGVAWYAIK